MWSNHSKKLALAATLWLVACGDPSSAPGADAGGLSDADLEHLFASCDEFIEIGCRMAYEQCGDEAAASRADMAELFGATDEASCLTAVGGFFTAICTAGADSARAGRAAYDPAAMDACVGASRDASCATYFGDAESPGLDSACVRFPFVEGIQPAGAACGADFECLGDAWCDGAADGTDGVCVEVGAGTACAGDFDCRDDSLYCDHPGNDFEIGRAEGGTCVPRRSAGDACDKFTACVDGLYCDDVNGFDPDTGVRLPGICVPPRELGEPCNDGEDCISQYCSTDDDPWLDEGVCLEPA